MSEGNEYQLESGCQVRLISDPSRTGFFTGKDRVTAGRRYLQVVWKDGKANFVLEPHLEILTGVPDDPLQLFAEGKLGRARDLRGAVTHVRLNGRLADLIYSMETTNTDFYAYQFKPVLNFLDSPSNGILIADEVGLGKTIEAGLIWTELRSRFDARKLVVLCPAMLCEKWKSELFLRFGIDAQIVKASEALKQLQEVRAGKRADLKLIGSIQGWSPQRGWDQPDSKVRGSNELAQFLREVDSEEPLIDLLVVDEAHKLKNPEAMAAKLGGLIRQMSAHVVLLSATPIQLHSQDLFYLLRLVDEDTFEHVNGFDEILQANEPLLAAKELVLRGGHFKKELSEMLEQAQSHELLRENRQLAAVRELLATKDIEQNAELRAKVAADLERLNLLGHAVNRTRKREVQEWRVVREAVAESIAMNPIEHSFYTAVTELVRNYCKKRDAHEGFLLVMPQRQLSSSMPAALREWQRKAESYSQYIDAEAYEDIGLEDSLPEQPGPLSRELIHKARYLADYATLKQGDTKYRRLIDMLRPYLAQHPQEKIVLFAFFRPTLLYLHERLAEDGIFSMPLMGGAGFDKQEIFRQFRETAKGCVLLASEVASEGIDLQFARVIVNYDLPWNPMKVEQRIGRLDRLGQQSEKITIWNLFYADTIDERIYNRLYTRLGIFERALGGLESILGEEISNLTMELLSDSLSPAQEAYRIDQSAQALANLRAQEEQLESEAANLIAHGDYIINKVRAARQLDRWINGRDLLAYVRDFFQERYPGSEFICKDEAQLIYRVRLSPDARFDLLNYLQEAKLQGKTRLSKDEIGGTLCSFQNRVSDNTDKSNAELVSQFNPLVRFVTRQLDGDMQQFYPTVALQIGHSHVPSIARGTYAFVLGRWSIHGTRDIERLAYFCQPMFSEAALDDTEAERLVTNAAAFGHDWLDVLRDADLAHASELLERGVDLLQVSFDEFVRQVSDENLDRADLQEASVRRHLDRQLAIKEQTIATLRLKGNDRLIPATEGQIRTLRERIGNRLREIEIGRKLTYRSEEIAVGIVRVT